MALQGEAKKLYHREYMRRQRAGPPTRRVVKPSYEQWLLRMRPAAEFRADRGQPWERLPPLPVLLRGGRNFVCRGARHARAMRKGGRLPLRLRPAGAGRVRLAPKAARDAQGNAGRASCEKPLPGLRLIEHLEYPGAWSSSSRPARWAARACVEASWLALSVGALTRLAPVQEPGGACGEAGGGERTGAGAGAGLIFHPPCAAIVQQRERAQ